MLYIVGTQKEAKKIQALLPSEVFGEVRRVVEILDEIYGSNRDVLEEDGGYICILENDCDVAELKAKYEVDLTQISPEYCSQLSDNWLKVLILCNNEFAINIILSTHTAVSERFHDEL